MPVLAIYLIVVGVHGSGIISVGRLGVVVARRAVAAGALILIGR